MGMSGGTSNGGQYVAVAFSPTGLMENSETYFCTGSSFASGVIEARHLPPIVDSSLEVLFVVGVFFNVIFFAYQ